MVVTKSIKAPVTDEISHEIYCKRCGSKLTGTVTLRGLSVICPKCKSLL